MALPIINIIGAGNLGKTIAKLIVTNRAGNIQGICNSTLNSAKNAAEFITEGKCFEKIQDLPPSDITFIATPDNILQDCCKELAKSENLQPGSIIVHFSGALTSKILESVKIKSCFIASIHPMRSFAQPEISVLKYNPTYCAFEGDQQAIESLQKTFQMIGSITFQINSDKKSFYHSSGVFASNYLIVLFKTAISCLEEAGVETEIAFKLILSLMQGTLNNLESTLSPEKSLTGPIKRGDDKTIIDHLNSLESKNLSNLYKQLGLAALNIAGLKKEKEEEIRLLLSEQTTTKSLKL